MRTCNSHLRYGDGFVLLAEGETVLQGMIDRHYIDVCYGMEMNVDRTKGMRFPRLPSLLHITLDQSRPKIVEYFNNLGCLMLYYTLN